jgi:acetoin utilization protein AcuB
MRAGKVRHLPVLDSAGRLAGIVTDRDLRHAILDPSLQERFERGLPAALQSLVVRDVMTWGAITVYPEMEIRQAARLMHHEKVGALPVVKNSRVVGILTETDVVKAFAEILDQGVLSRTYRWAITPP